MLLYWLLKCADVQLLSVKHAQVRCGIASNVEPSPPEGRDIDHWISAYFHDKSKFLTVVLAMTSGNAQIKLRTPFKMELGKKKNGVRKKLRTIKIMSENDRTSN